MNNTKIRAIVAGALGRTGGEVVSALLGGNLAKISLACGVDLRATAGETRGGVPIYADFDKISESADVIIDFSSAQGLAARLEFAKARGICIVLAPTGLSAANEAMISEYARFVPIFRAANFSLGAAVTEILCAQARRLLPCEFDAAIIEKHHKTNKDAPSGTALSIAKAIDGATEKSGKKTEIHALRLGTFSGEHEIIFAGDGETVTIIHHAENRRIFALGAIKAAGFLIGKPAGLYGMKDLLKELL